jgi:tetratricopeptide (TPR) repeat protein
MGPSHAQDASMFRAQAMSRLEVGDEAGALALITPRLDRDPRDLSANQLLALIHGAHGRDELALASMDAALATLDAGGADAGVDPRTDRAFVQRVRGNLLMSARRFDAALEALTDSLGADPQQPDLEVARGRCLISLDRYDDADAAFLSALERFPDRVEVATGYASTLFAVGRVHDVAAIADRFIPRFPDNIELREIRCFCGNFFDHTDPIAHREEHATLARMYAAAWPRPAWPIAPARNPEKRLRVGFLSGDFGDHACAYFLRAPILNMDRAKFEPVCITTMRHASHEPFASACAFHDLSQRSPHEVAAGLAGLGLDILVDCAGLSGGHAIGALSPRVAPVQCTWLGYPNTTGIDTMDARIVDAITDPPECDAHCTERLIRLSGCFLCYTPAANSPSPRATIGPENDDGPIVFGSFNRMMKVDGAALDAWIGVLNATPNSVLFIKQSSLSREMREGCVRRFTDAGLEPSRLRFAEWASDTSDHLAMYTRMDIALDAFPYNGTTTSFEAAWMGVPMVALLGNTHRSRVGASINTALGLGELIARDRDDFVRIARDLATDRPRLRTLQASMRDRILGRGGFAPAAGARGVCDARGYARAFERALRELWRGRCTRAR